MTPKLIFVYGTLMSGFGNNRLLQTSEFVKEGITLPEFTMQTLGGFPGVVVNGNTAILGEVWKVTDEEVLRQLDSLEGHPNWYVRTPITLEDGTNVEMYVYPTIGDSSRFHVVKSGSWREYYVSRRA